MAETGDLMPRKVKCFRTYWEKQNGNLDKVKANISVKKIAYDKMNYNTR